MCLATCATGVHETPPCTCSHALAVSELTETSAPQEVPLRRFQECPWNSRHCQTKHSAWSVWTKGSNPASSVCKPVLGDGMRELPQEFAFSLAFLFAGGVICMLFHPEFSVWWSGFVCMCFSVHCHCLSPNVSITPDGSPTPVGLQSPFPLPSLPKALAASGLPRIYRFAYCYFKYATVALGGPCPAVSVGSTQAVWHEAAPIPFRHE